MKKIAILRCMKVSNSCTGSGCLKAWNGRDRAFAGYAEEDQLISFFHNPHNVDALLKIDDKNALILVKNVELMPEDKKNAASIGIIPSAAELAYPTVEVPKGCTLVTVRYGITDGTRTEIISGLAFGDIVVYNPEWKDTILPLIEEETEDEPEEIVPDMPVSPEDDDEDSSIISPDADDTTKTDDEIKDEIKERVQQKQGNLQDKKSFPTPSKTNPSKSSNLSI